MTGQELVMRVAVEVMGWHECKYMKDNWCRENSENTGLWIEWDITGDNFNPLTNANHTMMVVDRMRELGWYCSMNNSDDEWEIEFSKCDGRFLIKEDTFVYDRNKNFGHAVCLAALKALEGEKCPTKP